MPNYFAGGSPWASDANALSALGDSMSQTLYKLPQLRQQRLMQMLQLQLERERLAGEQANQQSQIELRRSQLGVAPAHEELYKQQAEQHRLEGLKLLEVMKSAQDAAKYSQMQSQGLTPMRQGGSEFNLIPIPEGKGAPTLANLLPIGRAGLESAAARSAMLEGHPERFGQFQQQNAVNIANDPIMKILAPLIVTKTKAVENVPAGATALDMLTQQPIYASPREIPQGGMLVPGQGGAAIAQGMPPKATAASKAGDEYHGALSTILKTYVSQVAAGEKPSPEVSAVALKALNEMASGKTPATETKPPLVGEMRKGYMFKGGDPSKKESWEKVTE